MSKQTDAYDIGRKHERQRIIALIKDEVEQHSHPTAYYDNPFGFVIALIKGETE